MKFVAQGLKCLAFSDSFVNDCSWDLGCHCAFDHFLVEATRASYRNILIQIVWRKGDKSIYTAGKSEEGDRQKEKKKKKIFTSYFKFGRNRSLTVPSLV